MHARYLIAPYRASRQKPGGRIERTYLVELCAAIDRRLEQLRSEAPGLPVIEVDTDEVNYAVNSAAAHAIARELTTSLNCRPRCSTPLPAQPQTKLKHLRRGPELPACSACGAKAKRKAAEDGRSCDWMHLSLQVRAVLENDRVP